MMGKAKEKYTVVSPDGFTIHFEGVHDTPQLAWEAFEKWKSNYGRQGYYSTFKNGERKQIPLDRLKDACSLRTIK